MNDDEKTAKKKKEKCDISDFPNQVMCPVPFSALIFNPDGKIGCCRERGNKDVIAQMRKGITFDEIWNGEEIRKWRREFLDGNPVRCAEQIKNDKCHISGLNKQMAQGCCEFKEYQTNMPVLLSPDFNGMCNLSCVMCDVWELPNGLYDSEWDFWNLLETEVLPHVKILDPLGGEPFIQKDTYRIMEMAVRVNPDIRWRFTTNGQWKFSPFIQKQLDKLIIVAFQYSIDAATEETYQKVRKGGTLKKLLRNIEDHKEYYEKRIVSGMERAPYFFNSITVVMNNNWKEIPAIIKLMTSYDIEPLFVRCKDNDSLRIDLMPPEYIKEVLDFFFSEVNQFQYIFRLVNWLIESLPEADRGGYKKKLMFKTLSQKK